MSQQLFTAGLQARHIYPELKKYFYKEDLIITCEKFLTRVALLVGTHSGNVRTVEKSGILLQIKKESKSSDGDLT